MKKRRRVVITGLGIVAPNGIGKDDFWNGCIKGKSGVSPIKEFDVSTLNCKIAGRVEGFDPLDYMPHDVVRRSDRFVHLGLAAAKMAVEDSNLKIEKEAGGRVGICIGSGLGGLPFHEAQIITGFQRGFTKVHPLSVPKITPNAISSYIAITFNITGPNLTIANACASGTNAVGQGYRMILNDEADIILTGGAEAPLTPITFSAYCAMHVLSKYNNDPRKASRPFDRDRDGFVMGEGAAVLIMEELSSARARKAHIYAEIIGYGTNSGAYHMVMPDPEGRDAAAAMTAALRDAELGPHEVDYINAHGTSTRANDSAETRAIKEVFGRYAYSIPVSSTKSMTGHTIGASGGIEAVVCALTVENDLIPPTINYEHSDPECDLDYVPKTARVVRVNVAVSNSFGFGNNNASIIFKKYRDAR